LDVTSLLKTSADEKGGKTENAMLEDPKSVRRVANEGSKSQTVQGSDLVFLAKNF